MTVSAPPDAAAARGGEMRVGNSVVAMVVFAASDVIAFGSLLIVYAFLRVRAHGRFSPPLELGMAGLITLFLLLSSATLALARRAGRAGRGRSAAGYLLVTAAFGAAFVVGQAVEYVRLWQRGALSAVRATGEGGFFLITGYHGLHVAVGVIALLWFAVRAWRRGTPPPRALSLYWLLVDGLWLVILTLVYLL